MPIVLDGTAGITTPNVASTTSTLGPLTQALNLGSTGQIVFPATQNASANANTLDDYEEGTWTPVISPEVGSVTHSNQTGRYTKIGRFVYLQCRVNLSAISSPSGSFNLAGMPFVGNSVNQGRSGNIQIHVNNLTGQNNGTVLGSFVSPGSTSVSLRDNTQVNINASNLTSSTQLDFSIVHDTN